LQSLANIIRLMKPGKLQRAWHMTRVGAKRNTSRGSVGRPERKRSWKTVT